MYMFYMQMSKATLILKYWERSSDGIDVTKEMSFLLLFITFAVVTGDIRAGSCVHLAGAER